jgi:hypothetical protein
MTRKSYETPVVDDHGHAVAATLGTIPVNAEPNGKLS